MKGGDRESKRRWSMEGLNVSWDSVGTLILKVLTDLMNKRYILKNYTDV